MDFRILGPLEVDDDDGLAVDFGGRQQRLVLAMLLLHRNEVVSVDRLIDVVWRERAPANAVKNVQIHVSRLRKALEATSPGSVVQTRPNGYALAVAPGELDVDRFERLVEEGRRALAAGEPAQAETALREALSLRRGEPLSDFAYDSFAQSEIARLDELQLAALEERLQADLALGRHEDITAELRGLVAQHPLRERLRGHLMLALYRSGRKADALRVYDEARRALAEELGLEPSETLQGLQRAVLTDDPSLVAPPRVSPSRKRGPIAGAPSPLLAGRRGALIGIGGALLLAAALAVALLAVTRDRPSAGIVSVPPDSLAQIDPEANTVVAAIPLGARPATVVFAHGALWAANLDDDSVSRIDPHSRREAKRIPMGIAPIGLAGGRDAVWAIGGDGFVRRIDPFFNRVTRRIGTGRIGTVAGGGLMAGAVASTSEAVWVLSGGFRSVPRLYRVDPAKEQATEVVTTGDGPAAIAAGFGDLWVADYFENTVSRIEPSGAVAETIPVLRGASAVAVGEGAVWVAASLDDKLVRIDPQTNAVVTAIDVGRYPVGIAVGAGAVWVANRDDGTVSRIDPESNEVVERIEVGSRPAGIAFAAGSVWVTNQVDARAAARRSDGTLRIRSSGDFETDPHANPEPQLAYLTCAKLLNHPDAPAPAGTRLVPEIAAALPVRSADARTFTFTIRKGFAFSPPLHESVTAQTFVHTIERSTKLLAVNPTLIVGQLDYLKGEAGRISGVVAKGDELSITLVRPASDEFLAQLAQPGYCAVPLNAPVDRTVRKLPSAGPYYVAEHEPDRLLVLKRNPNYRGSRPRRPREIHVQIGGSQAQVFDDVLAGRADYTYEIPLSARAERKLAARYGPATDAARDGRQRYFVNPALGLGALVLNTGRPLFADVRLRKAVNHAIDRRALARIGHFRFSGDFPAIPTAQYLPPTMPGASRTRLYPLSGDLRAARRLRPDASGTAVVYTCTHAQCRRQAQVIRSNLRELGLDVDIREFPYLELFERASRPGEPYDILTAWWLPDYADPANYLNDFLGAWYRPGAQLTAKLERALRLTGAARERAYAALSDEIALDVAPFVPYAAAILRDFFSERVGCQVFQPVFRTDLAALCLRR